MEVISGEQMGPVTTETLLFVWQQLVLRRGTMKKRKMKRKRRTMKRRMKRKRRMKKKRSRVDFVLNVSGPNICSHTACVRPGPVPAAPAAQGSVLMTRSAAVM